MKESRQDFESREDLSDGSREALREEFAQYKTYTEKDGQRRMEIGALREKSRENILFLENIIREAEDVMDYIDSWEPDDEDDELDEEALWAPVRSHFSRYPVLRLGMEFGVKDKEKEGWLERIGDLASKGILELVLPEGTVVSGRSLKLNGFPSKERTPGNPAGEGKRNLGVQTLWTAFSCLNTGSVIFLPLSQSRHPFTSWSIFCMGRRKTGRIWRLLSFG